MTKVNLFFLLIIIFLSCSKENASRQESQIIIHEEKEELPLISINYDFDNLKLYLNESISDTPIKGFWNWDHMNGGATPDSLSIDYYENREQASFFFEGQETLPALSVKTKRNKVIEFYATTIFEIENTKKERIRTVLDSLTRIDLLQDESIKAHLAEKHIYKKETSEFIETIELKLTKEGYDRIVYSIKNNNPKEEIKQQ